jgi:hypothetical protein
MDKGDEVCEYNVSKSAGSGGIRDDVVKAVVRRVCGAQDRVLMDFST